MKENRLVRPIRLPDYLEYRNKICQEHEINFPLTPLSVEKFKNFPVAMNRTKKGWPWEKPSVITRHDKDYPKISIVIPTYRQGRYLEEAIRSVVLQNYPSMELIIVDGGSSDETLEVANYYRDFISLFISEKDNGQSHAINKGFSMASGELYHWLNSDDYLNKNSFLKAVPLFLKDPDLDIVYGDGYVFNEQSQLFSPDPAPLVLERYLRFGGIVLSHSLIWRSRVHCKIWEDLNCAMDAELWLRLFPGHKFKHCHFPIGISRKHPEQKTLNKAIWEEKWQEDYEKYIWRHYPSISAPKWKLRVYEYRLFQKLFKLYRHVFGLAQADK